MKAHTYTRRLSCNCGVLAAVALALLALYPQLTLWYERDGDYNRFYGLQQYDEEVYAGYINSLLLGRPRRSEPIQCGTNSNYESLFSIQFIPAYLIAIPARVLGISASVAFILLGPIMAFISTLAVYLLIKIITRESLISAVGALCVLCLGTMLSGQGLLPDLLGSSSTFHGLLFLRRYLPAIPFPLFFLFCTLTWRAFTETATRGYSLASGFVFAVLVFSYFYLWTAALAWLICFSMIWIIAIPRDISAITTRLLPIVFCGGIAGLLYGKMLSQRSPTSDQVQALQFTHGSDLFRLCEVVCVIIVLVLLYSIRRRHTKLSEPITIFTLSMLLTPFLVFNQQIITGHSLQPYHYEFYVANYATVLGGFMTGWILCHQRMRIRHLLFIAFVALFWGWLEVAVSTKINHYENVQRDALIAVADKLKGDGFVYSEDVWIVGNHISTFASLPVLWGLHTQTCVGLSREEGKQRFYQYLYYGGSSPERLAKDLNDRQYLPTAALFGYERAGVKLLEGRKLASQDEIEVEVHRYAAYVANFTSEQATHPRISYVITTENLPDYPLNIDRWYERDQGEQIGNFTLYHVTPRNQ